MSETIQFLMNKKTNDIVEKMCKADGINYETFKELIEHEFKMQSKQKKKGVNDGFDDILARILLEDSNEN